jgi:REP element-mobilizing transposase RayT
MIKDRPRRLELIYFDRPLYFVTFCTRNGQKISSLECAHSLFRKYTEQAISDFGVAVGRYTIMPDHIHLFVRIGDSTTLSKWIGGLKRAMSTGLQSQHLWQPGFFDHILRSNESYSRKWEYMCQNPVRAGLVKESEDWPYQGEITLLEPRIT